MPVSRGLIYMAAAFGIVYTIILSLGSFTTSPSPEHSSVFPKVPVPDLSPKNATLGFGQILVLSRGTEWRLHGLHAAAAYTGLELIAPKQPFQSPEIVEFFQQAGPADIIKPTIGAAHAWLAHLDLLRHIVQSDYATALIIEDDVDWSVDIKRQMTTLAEKVRAFTHADPLDQTPYGSEWDVLWIGLCGETYNTIEVLDLMSWDDDTNGPHSDWRGVCEVSYIQDLPEGQRHLFKSNFPSCTWAYAVTATSAQKILEWSSAGQAEAYDIHLRYGCRENVLSCFSVVDQLFHQHLPSPEMGQSSDIRVANDDLTFRGDRDEFVPARGSTDVILHSARCAALYGEDCRPLDVSQ